MKKRQSYSDEFKDQELELAEQIGQVKAARQLGISVGALTNWKKSARKKTQPAAKPSLEEENCRLKAELAEQKKVRRHFDDFVNRKDSVAALRNFRDDFLDHDEPGGIAIGPMKAGPPDMEQKEPLEIFQKFRRVG